MKFFLKKLGRRGFALLTVMIIVGCAALVAGATIRRTYAVASLNQRAKQYQSSMYAAEAAVEKVYARFRLDYMTGGHAAVSNNVSLYRNMVPTVNENPFWRNFEFSNAGNGIGQTYVNLISNKTFIQMDGTYAGLNGWRGIYRIVSNARPLNGLYAASAGVQQDVSLDTIPAFQFAIFYNGQLEFTQCAPLTVRGRTHANGPICMGAASGNTLRFEGLVTTTSSIVTSNLGGYSSFATPVYAGTPSPGRQTQQASLNLPIGQANTADAVREIINVPPSGEAVNSPMGQERFYNKAGVVLLISNNNITVNIKDLGTSSGFISNYTYWSYSNAFFASNTNVAAQRTNLQNRLPFLSLTNRFYDYRESKWVMASQIDMGILKTWLVTNSAILTKFPTNTGQYPTIMYVGDFRTVTNLHAVRVINGALIPTNGINHASARGFTLATANPLYVWGNYNLPNSSHADQANPSATFPASFICDAITILSGAWTDSIYGNGSTSLSSRGAANTTVNAAMIAGSVYTTGTGAGNWSGGVHNLTRLLENWSGDTLTLNSSLVNLYNSVKANTQFQNPGIYYNAPTRNFNFNTNYLVEAKLPPGTPTISQIQRFRWTTTPINTVTYNGPY